MRAVGRRALKGVKCSRLSVYLSIRLSICQSAWLSVRLPVRLGGSQSLLAASLGVQVGKGGAGINMGPVAKAEKFSPKFPVKMGV